MTQDDKPRKHANVIIAQKDMCSVLLKPAGTLELLLLLSNDFDAVSSACQASTIFGSSDRERLSMLS